MAYSDTPVFQQMPETLQVVFFVIMLLQPAAPKASVLGAPVRLLVDPTAPFQTALLWQN
jgi:hypothetical protein